MNKNFNHFTPYQRLDLLVKMCYLFGLNVIDMRASIKTDTYVIKMLNTDIDPIMCFFDDSFPISKIINNQSYKYEIDIFDSLCLIDFLRIRAFKIKDCRLMLGNPFFKHFEIATAKSYDEALVLIDLSNTIKESREDIQEKFIKELKGKQKNGNRQF